MLWGSAALAEHYTLPLFVTSTTAGTTQGVLRLLNDTGESGSVEIHAIDDAGTRTGPATFTLNAWTAVEFDASELASGNAMKGLSEGLGTLSGDVRLAIETELQIVPSAYVRAGDGTLSAMHDTVRASVAAGGGGGYRYLVPIFNSASEVTQVSRLRLINPGARIASITIEGRDDTGTAATGGTVQLTVPGAAPVDHEAFNERFGASGIEYRRGSDRVTYMTPASDRFTETGESGGVAFTNMGSDCYPGLLVRIEGSCTYPGTTDEFTVNERGRGRFLTFLAGIRIRVNNETIDGRVYDFEATHQGDGVWRIDRVAGMTEVPSFGAAANPGDRTYMEGTAIDPLTLPEATGGNGRLTYGLSPDVPGLSFIASMRQLTGTPSTAGIYDMTYTVTDADGDTDTLGFTITVEAAEDEGNGGGGGGGGGTGSAVTVENGSCRGTRTGASTFSVQMSGTVRAHRAVSSVRVLGYVNGLLLGADSLGDIPAGGTRNFSISGDLTITANRISSCNADIHFLPAGSEPGGGSVSIDFGTQLWKLAPPSMRHVTPTSLHHLQRFPQNLHALCVQDHRLAYRSRRDRRAGRPTRLATIAENVDGQRLPVELHAVPVKQDQRKRPFRIWCSGPPVGALGVRCAVPPDCVNGCTPSVPVAERVRRR